MPLVHDAVAIRLGLVEAPEGPASNQYLQPGRSTAVEEVAHAVRDRCDEGHQPTEQGLCVASIVARWLRMSLS